MPSSWARSASCPAGRSSSMGIICRSMSIWSARAASPTGRGRQIPDKMLVLPIVAYGYTGHVMDFPGTINNDFEHFMHHVLDITKSLAYHGFKKIMLLNGHGSNMPNLDLVARRTNLETDAECVCTGLVELADRRQGVPAALAAEQVPRRLSPTPASWKRRCTCISTATTSGRTRSRAARSASTRTTARSTGSTCSAGPGDGRFVDEQLHRNGRAGRGGTGDGREGAGGLRGSGEAARAVRHLVQGPAEGRAPDRHRKPPTMPIPWGQRDLSE